MFTKINLWSESMSISGLVSSQFSKRGIHLVSQTLVPVLVETELVCNIQKHADIIEIPYTPLLGTSLNILAGFGTGKLFEKTTKK